LLLIWIGSTTSNYRGAHSLTPALDGAMWGVSDRV